MIRMMEMDVAQRRASIQQASILSNINVQAIEKDWWVTLVLKALFNSKYKEYFVFKGGTSLSKCWKLIERFSEDIDLGLSPGAIGLDYLESPSGSYVKRIKRIGCEFVSNELRKTLQNELLFLGMKSSDFTLDFKPIKPESPDTDPQTLLLQYSSLFDQNPYILNAVKIEISLRSWKEPYSNCLIQTLLNEHFPLPAYDETPFEIHVINPERTFLEKLVLLHEELQKEYSKIRYERNSRHFYDLERMMDSVFVKRIYEGDLFYKQLFKHRKFYTPVRGFDYDHLELSQINFIPPEPLMENFKLDYQIMKDYMIYGDSLSFEDLMTRMHELKSRLSGV